jgi:hypothetical protein
LSQKAENFNRIDSFVTDPRGGSNTVPGSETPIIHPCRGCKPELCNRYAVEDLNSPFIYSIGFPTGIHNSYSELFWFISRSSATKQTKLTITRVVIARSAATKQTTFTKARVVIARSAATKQTTVTKNKGVHCEEIKKKRELKAPSF